MAEKDIYTGVTLTGGTYTFEEAKQISTIPSIKQAIVTGQLTVKDHDTNVIATLEFAPSGAVTLQIPRTGKAPFSRRIVLKQFDHNEGFVLFSGSNFSDSLPQLAGLIAENERNSDTKILDGLCGKVALKCQEIISRNGGTRIAKQHTNDATGTKIDPFAGSHDTGVTGRFSTPNRKSGGLFREISLGAAAATLLGSMTYFSFRPTPDKPIIRPSSLTGADPTDYAVDPGNSDRIDKRIEALRAAQNEPNVFDIHAEALLNEGATQPMPPASHKDSLDKDEVLKIYDNVMTRFEQALEVTTHTDDVPKDQQFDTAIVPDNRFNNETDFLKLFPYRGKFKQAYDLLYMQEQRFKEASPEQQKMYGEIFAQDSLLSLEQKIMVVDILNLYSRSLNDITPTERDTYKILLEGLALHDKDDPEHRIQKDSTELHNFKTGIIGKLLMLSAQEKDFPSRPVADPVLGGIHPSAAFSKRTHPRLAAQLFSHANADTISFYLGNGQLVPFIGTAERTSGLVDGFQFRNAPECSIPRWTQPPKDDFWGEYRKLEAKKEEALTFREEESRTR